MALEPFWPSNLKRTVYTTEYVERFLAYVGDPQNKPRAIHVAGTSGKTSTSYYVAALLKQAGKRVGLLTSPHIEKLTERIQVDLRPLPEAEFCSELTIFMRLVEESGVLLSHAEILYSFGYWEFVRQRVDYIVIEVGMGGLLDATNVIDRPDKIAVITDIGLDHTNVLGETIPEIAAHKAGIVRLHNTVFCHLQNPEAIKTIEETCRQKQADLHIVGQDKRTPTKLPLFQQRNFSLALETVEFALERFERKRLTAEQIHDAAEVHIPGRMETFVYRGKIIILDNAHNQQKLQALCKSLLAQYPDEPFAMLVAFLEGRGRSTNDMVNELAPYATHLIVTELPSVTRTHQGSDVAATAAAYTGDSVEAISNRSAAYKALLARPEELLVITGSTFLLEEMRPIVRTQKGNYILDVTKLPL